MHEVIYSPLAEEDLREIWNYIAVDNPGAADHLLERVDAKLRLYAEFPRMGTDRSEFTAGLRSFSVKSYVVFYRIVGDGVEAVRILHGAREMKRHFRQ